MQLLSIAVTGIGAYILVLKDKVVHDAIDFFFDPSTLMCTAGSVAVFVSFVGWLGALREYTSFLRLVSRHLSLLVISFVDVRWKAILAAQLKFDSSITDRGRSTILQVCHVASKRTVGDKIHV